MFTRRRKQVLRQISCASPSEPIFVPNIEATNDDEDDDVILSVVLEQRTKRSYLLVLDAKTFTELARAHLPVHIPLSFMENFIQVDCFGKNLLSLSRVLFFIAFDPFLVYK